MNYAVVHDGTKPFKCNNCNEFFFLQKIHAQPAKMDLNKKSLPKLWSVQTMIFGP